MRHSHVLAVLMVCLIATGCWLLSPGQAQPAPAAGRSAIGVLNVPQIFRDSREFKAMTAQFEQRATQLKSNADAQEKALADRAEDIRRRFQPDTKDYQDRMRELLTERIRYRVTLEVESKDMLLEHQRLTEAFYSKLCRVVDDIAREQGFDVVLYREEFQTRSAQGSEELLAMIRQRKILYCSTRADITDTVLKRLDAMVDAPAAAPAPVPAPR